MVKAVAIGKEIVVTTANKVGIMAHITRMLADHGINIEGVAGYAQDTVAKLMFVVDDTLRAKEAIIKAGYKDTRESEVVILDLENKPGALNGATSMLASEKIDITYIYGTACPEGCPARIIMKTSENEKTVVTLSAK